MLENIHPSTELRGLASRRAKPDEFKSVRHPLVEEEVAKGWEVAQRNKTTTRLRRPKAPDKLLEDRVWTLFYRMGFPLLSAQGGAHLLLNADDPKTPGNQIDVAAIDDEVGFAVECKSSAKPRKFSDFSGDLAKDVGLREGFIKAIRSQYPVSHKRPAVFALWTSGLITVDNDKTRAQAAGVPLLDETDLVYYESLVGQVGSAARYQFLADLLQGKPVPGLEVTVPAIRTKIGGSNAYTFSVSPEYLLKIAFVSHRARGKASDVDAYQRMLKRARLRSIRQYIEDGGRPMARCWSRGDPSRALALMLAC